MERKQKIQTLLNRLSTLQQERSMDLPEYVGKMLDDDTEQIRIRAQESSASKAIKRLAKEVYKVQKDPKADNILKSLTKAEKKLAKRADSLEQDFSEKLDSLASELSESEKRGTSLSSDGIRSLHDRFIAFREDFDAGMNDIENGRSVLEGEVSAVRQELSSLFDGIQGDIAVYKAENASVGVLAAEAKETAADAQKQSVETAQRLEELRKRVNSRIGSLDNHGGNMNRNIAIGGNVNALSQFTDINLKAGNNVTITYAANHATGYTDVTITSSGTGGGGITREINNVAVPTAAGSTPGIDYVYLASGTLTITLPTAIGNTNLYTIKNVGSGIVTIDTTAGQTIDGDATVIMPVQFTSVDLISNGTNWAIT
jgi:predicted transcriptional regulator